MRAGMCQPWELIPGGWEGSLCPQGKARGLWCQPGAVCPCLQGQAGEKPLSNQCFALSLTHVVLGTVMPSAMAFVALASPPELGCHQRCPGLAQMGSNCL